ncbi:dTDP-4-dehydrorhamnose reductase [Marinobacter daqiaonensis]|uniref:dTDP-4-dehydrorhamnose reductase n=1 Tax=Marinobacter daqiaonensis TaxID=650891 RepID=A0A1I6J563_9GAMM|nr:sugar nucleotide-binding protein [Marinobacter daqiaonensis]SFR74123.1 dTDP-4-dehydrorhamnose reductase [Marinobacter daqiaonensis]
MNVLVVHDNGVLGRLLLNRLNRTPLVVTPLLISDPAHVEMSKVGQWIPADTDVIVNAMWLTDPEPAEADPEQTRLKAFTLPMAMAEFAATNDMIMVQLSTSYVFDGRKQSAYLCSNPGHPIGQLGIWQWECEQVMRTVLPRHILLRTGWGLQRFIRKVYESGRKGEPLRMSSRYLGQPVAAGDLARVLSAMLMQLDCGAEVWGTYQYAGAEEINQYDLALAIAELPELDGDKHERSIRVVDEAPAKGDVEPENATLGCLKIRNTFGVKQMPWRTALSDEFALSGLAGALSHDLKGLKVE